MRFFRSLTFLLLFTAGLMAADAFLMKSVDGGKSWTSSDPVPEGRYLRWFQVDSRSSALYALTQRDLQGEWQLSVSTDGGESWDVRQTFPESIYRMVAAPASVPDTYYLAYEVYSYPRKEVRIVKVTDQGRCVEQYRAEGLAVLQDSHYIGYLMTLQADLLAPAKLYALVSQELCCNDEIFGLFQALWVSVDGGRNWERTEPPSGDACNYPEMQVDPADAAVYLACGSHLSKSVDGGASWSVKPFPNGERIWNLQIGPGTPPVLYGNRLGVIWKSVDGAESWERTGTIAAGSGPWFLTPHPEDSSVLFAGTPEGVAKSVDGGQTWTTVTEVSLQAESPLRPDIDPRMPDRVYLSNWRRLKVRINP